MRKLSLVLCTVITAILALPAEAVVEAESLKSQPQDLKAAGECDPTITGEPCVVTMFAGQYTEVGTVTLFRDSAGYVRVTYQITDSDWYIVETHLYVDPDAPPSKSSPGQFPYKHELDEPAYTDVYELGYFDPEACLYVAAHAVVVTYAYPVLDDFAVSLPEQVTMSVQYPNAGDPSYFVTTVSGGTILDGVYDGWCIDTDNTIDQNTSFTANVYSSYEAISGLVEHPENLDLVNWIINQGFVGQPSPGCTGNYTYGDVQRAIWTLVEDENSTSGLGPYSQCRVNEIVAAAYDEGEAFVPSCGDTVAVILVPVNGQQITIAQITLIGYPAEVGCEDLWTDETAWGQGGCPFKTGWGSYFQCCPPTEICADFTGFGSGDSVEGMGTVLTGMAIETPNDGAVAIYAGATPTVYGAPNNGSCGGSGFPGNGCMGPLGGFSNDAYENAGQPHYYEFWFDEAVSEFSLHMLDFGDYNPTRNAEHFAVMTAYDEYDNEIDRHELSYESAAATNPRTSDYGDLVCPPTYPGGTGDACSAVAGEPGNWTWNVSGAGIAKVTLEFGVGFDPKIGFDNLCVVR
jgi:hypothetical protein